MRFNKLRTIGAIVMLGIARYGAILGESWVNRG